MSIDDSTTQHEIVLVEDSSLTGGEITLRRIKLHLDLITWQRRDLRLDLPGSITGLYLSVKGSCRRLPGLSTSGLCAGGLPLTVARPRRLYTALPVSLA